MNSRIAKRFMTSKAEAKKILVSFVTAGDPSIAHTVPALHALVRGGVDMLELGIPFSDPEAEGPSIQKSSERALANGVSVNSVFSMAKEFREKDKETPVILMGYLNSVLATENFSDRAYDAGVDGLIIVNLPPEEAEDFQADLQGNGIDLIYLLAPTTTDKRALYITERASGFLYYVSLKGTTGAGHIQIDEIENKIENLRGMTDLPICVGFGIKDAGTAAQVGLLSDGVVVGSALVDQMAGAGDPLMTANELEASARALRKGLDSV